MLKRRQAVLAGAAALLSMTDTAWSKPMALKTVLSREPFAQIVAGGPGGLLGVSTQGNLWSLALDGRGLKQLAEGLDPETPLAVGHGRIAARRSDGGLWVHEASGSSVSVERNLAPHAGLLVLPLAIVAVLKDGNQHRLARLEPNASGIWQRVALSERNVLPDARPLQADLDGSGDGGHVVVLAGPNSERYNHGVLGDAIEATRVTLLERHNLKLMRELVLDAPWVLEDIAPRKVRLAGGRDGLLSVHAGPAGGQLVLIDADLNNASSLRLAAQGPALGRVNRWMSPMVCGEHWLAVHTPHIGGVLHAYRQDGIHLQATRWLSGVSNHRIGSRWLDTSSCSGQHLLIADQAGRHLLLIDTASNGRVLDEIAVTSKVVGTVSLQRPGVFAVLQEDGAVSILNL
jgi:hypothetical protein